MRRRTTIDTMAIPWAQLIMGVAMASVLVFGDTGYWYIATHRVPAWTDLAPTRSPAGTAEHLLRYLCG